MQYHPQYQNPLQMRSNSTPKHPTYAVQPGQGTPQNTSMQQVYSVVQQQGFTSQSLSFRRGSEQQIQAQLPSNPIKQVNLNNKSTFSDTESVQNVQMVIGPSTPQKMNMFQSQNSLKLYNQINQQSNDSSSFRQSSTKKNGQQLQQVTVAGKKIIPCSDSPQPTYQVKAQSKIFNGNQQLTQQQIQLIQSQNNSIVGIQNQSQKKIKQVNNQSTKENQTIEIYKRVNTEQSNEGNYCSVPNQNDAKIQQLQAENKKLNDFIQRQFKEKQEMKNIIDKFQAKETESRQNQDETMNLHALQERVERLALIVEEQAQEIEQWKSKYQDACENEQANTLRGQKQLIEQMEKQILVVVEENERLNNIKEQLEIKAQNLEQKLHENSDSNDKIQSLEEYIYDLENQLNVMKDTENGYQCEISVLRGERTSLAQQCEILQKQIQNSFIEQPSPKSQDDQQILQMNLKRLEKQVEDLSLFYQDKIASDKENYEQKIASIILENQLLKDQIQDFQLKKPKPLVQDAQIQLKKIKENINQSIKLFTQKQQSRVLTHVSEEGSVYSDIHYTQP